VGWRLPRLHEGDVSGDILAREANYCHMMVPMYFDPLRYPPAPMGRPVRTLRPLFERLEIGLAGRAHESQ
jgi:hypothetical protein